MENSKSTPLPPRILVLLDRLSNVQFANLTRKQLKDQVEELKIALIEEFSKTKPESERPQTKPANVSNDAINRTRTTNPSVTPSTATRKDVPKKHMDTDKKQGQNNTNKEKRESTKEVTNKITKSSVSAKPSYADLLKMAEKISKEPSPVYTNSKEVNSTEETTRNLSHGSKNNSHQGHRSPPSGRSNQVPRREHDRDGRSNISRTDDRNGMSSIRSNKDHRSSHHTSSDSKRTPTNNRPVDDKSRNGKDSQPKRREPKKSKKEEEEEILERKRQKIREENERVKLRNEVLAGKRSASEFKNVVKQVSHGNTVLSCHPATSSSSSRRDDPNFGRPLVRRAEDDRPIRGKDYLDDYEEEDDDDSFIDDDDGRDGNETPDVSRHIRDIFGYDKRKYIGMDEDIEEASYSQIMKEEARSQRIGRQEDLADMKEEMKQKKLKRERLKQRLDSR